MSLAASCSDDDALTINDAAEVDSGNAAATGLFGAADVTFDGVTASISGVTCTNESRFVVSPIVSDTFTVSVDGDPVAGTWNVQVTQPGDPDVVWTAAAPTVAVDGDTVAGSAQMQRVDDPTVTAELAFVVDC